MKTKRKIDIVDIVLWTLNRDEKGIAAHFFSISWADSDFSPLDIPQVCREILSGVNEVLELPFITAKFKAELKDYKKDLEAHLETLQN